MAFRALLRTCRTAAILAFGLALSGCATSSLDELTETTPQGSEFTQNLFKNYSYLARSFGEVGTPSDASFDQEGSLSLSDTSGDVSSLANAYAAKALDAAKGFEVSPEPPPD